MLAPCDLLPGRGDSLGRKILSQRWLGLTTLGVKSPVGQIKEQEQEQHQQKCHLKNFKEKKVEKSVLAQLQHEYAQCVQPREEGKGRKEI